ncbi:phage holin family protein [Neptunitalea chrysea]|nr:phage holin family protein [Neptunitalea chrysea]
MKIPIVFQAFATKKGLLMAPVAVLPIVISAKGALKVLFALMILDFITGIYASHVEKRKVEKINPELKNEPLISSEKLKLSGVKFMLYVATILLAYFVEKIFFIKSFAIGFSDAHFTITVIVIAFWIVVEFYSVVFENFKRMGFDVIRKLTKIISKFKSTKNQLQS